MIDSFHIAEEVLEMLVASLYLNPGPYEVPQQPQVAFFRFLHKVATTDWNSEYIVLNINNELNRKCNLEFFKVMIMQDNLSNSKSFKIKIFLYPLNFLYMKNFR